MSKPTVLITLAGSNSRLFPFNQGISKSGLTLLGQPLIVRTIREFLNRDYDSFVIVHSGRDKDESGIPNTLKRHFPDLKVTYLEQVAPLGMGNAILTARQYLSGQFIYTGGYHPQAAAVADQLLSFSTTSVVCSADTEHPWDYGILSIEGDLAVGITEKPSPGTEVSNQKIQLIYALDQEFLTTLASTNQSDHYNFETALNVLMQQRKVGHLALPECLASLKYPWHLFDIQKELFSQLKSARDRGAKISPTAILDETNGPILIERGATIGDFAKIVGPAYIGEECLVGDYAFIRQSSLEAHSIVGAKTEVVRSLIMSHSSLHFGYLADSIIGNHVKIGAGLITANKRLDRQPVLVTVKGQPISSGRKELGVMIGDDSNLGIRVNTMPGVIVGPQANIFPATTLFQNVALGEVVKTK